VAQRSPWGELLNRFANRCRLGKAVSKRRLYFDCRQQGRQKSTATLKYPVTELSYDGYILPRIPSRPEAAVNDNPFECPLCCHTITASDESAWVEHVYEDLLPCICLQEVSRGSQDAHRDTTTANTDVAQDCTNGAHQFARQEEWQHHMEEHDTHWFCPFGCLNAYMSSDEFELHLQAEHILNESMHASLVKSCARKPVTMSWRPCTLCKKPIANQSFWYSHVGQHLERLALHAVTSRGSPNEPRESPDRMPSMARSRSIDSLVSAQFARDLPTDSEA
jgi:hypothetical protein